MPPSTWCVTPNTSTSPSSVSQHSTPLGTKIVTVTVGQRFSRGDGLPAWVGGDRVQDDAWMAHDARWVLSCGDLGGSTKSWALVHFSGDRDTEHFVFPDLSREVSIDLLFDYLADVVPAELAMARQG